MKRRWRPCSAGRTTICAASTRKSSTFCVNHCARRADCPHRLPQMTTAKASRCGDGAAPHRGDEVYRLVSSRGVAAAPKAVECSAAPAPVSSTAAARLSRMSAGSNGAASRTPWPALAGRFASALTVSAARCGGRSSRVRRAGSMRSAGLPSRVSRRGDSQTSAVSRSYVSRRARRCGAYQGVARKQHLPVDSHSRQSSDGCCPYTDAPRRCPSV